jgi:tight adherence protein B
MLVFTFIGVFVLTGATAYLIANSVNKGKESSDMWTYLDTLVEEKDYTQRVLLELQKAGINLRFSEYLLIYIASVIVGALLGGVIFQSIIAAIFGMLIGLATPYFFVKQKQHLRLKKIDSQLPDALVLMSSGLKAGYSFIQGMELVSKDGPEPLASEFGRAVKEINLGYPTERALDDLVERIGSDDLDLAMTVIKIQRQVGGNLAVILEQIVHTIRERVRVKGEINTLTAQGKLQGIILAFIPPLVCFGLYMLKPDFITPLFTTVVGQAILVLSIVMQLIGGALIIKITRIKV